MITHTNLVLEHYYFYEYHKREKFLLTWIDMGYGLHSFNSILCPGTDQYKKRTYEEESAKDC